MCHPPLSMLPPMLAMVLASVPAAAHPVKISSLPAADATVAPTDRIEIRFSEPLSPALTRASLVMTDMPGMAMAAPMVMKIRTALNGDGTRLVATLAKPLPRGTYAFRYQVGSSESDRIEGDMVFTVR